MRDITKIFGPVRALSNVSIKLYENEILGLVGENGAGKSTLMKVLSGSWPANSYTGEIYVDGKKQNFMSPVDSEHAGIEMIYQEISMHSELTIAENIFLGRIPNRHGIIDRKRMYQECEEYLKLVGLSLNPKTIVRNLSTSQQQMVAIARALSRKPRILILDEPTSALTETEVEFLLNNLKKFKTMGISSIYISHKLTEVFRVCDRITTMRDGNTINTSDCYSEAEQTDTIIEEMIGRKLDVMYPKEKVPIADEILRFENITVKGQTEGKNKVDHASMVVHAGEIVALAGLVGAGRSETVNALFGGLKKTAGEVWVDGKSVKITCPRDAINAGIGLVTEDRRATGFIKDFNIRENISVASVDQLAKGVIFDKKREKEIANKQMKDISIKAPSIETMVTKLSGGNQQKVVLAKWLCKDLKVLILDEPTRGVDVGAKAQIYEIMTSMVKKGIGIIMISSELPELIAMCDRMYVMAEGKITAELRGDEITEANMMKNATG